MDFPPLVAVQAWLTRALFGDSLLSIRLFPSLAGAALVWLTGALARELGGGRRAQVLAAVAIALAPYSLAFSSYLSMNAIEPLIWTGCAWVLLRMIRTGETRLWLAFGALAGVGLLNKDTMIFFGFALVAGLLLTPERRLFRSGFFWAAGALALLIALPNLVWQVQHHFPHLELLANIKRNGRDVQFSAVQFFGVQVLFMNPVAAPIWLGGLLWLLASAAARPARILGWSFLIATAVLLALHGKVYYLGPAFPMLIAAGAVALEHVLGRPWILSAYTALVAVTGLALAPVALPSLPPHAYLAYTRALRIAQPRLENRKTSEMPQFFADRFGWPEMAESVARAYHALPAEDRARCAIFGNDYGQAGAIDFYGPRLGLPRAIGGHLTYWYWGPRGYTGECVIVLGDREEVLRTLFDQVEPVAVVGHRYAMAQEHFTAYLCRKPRGWTLDAIWPRIKRWN